MIKFSIPPFVDEIRLYNTDELDSALKYIAKKYNNTDEIGEHTLAWTVGTIMWIKQDYGTPEWYDALSHEAVHVAVNILEHHDINDNEVLAIFTGYIVGMVVRKINKLSASILDTIRVK